MLNNIMKIIITEEQSYMWSIICLLALGAIFEIISNQLIELHYSILTNIVCLTYYLIIIWEKKSKTRAKTIIKDLCIITLMSIQLTYIFYLIKETKEKEEMEWFANVVGDESDKTFENSMINISEKIKNDEYIINWQKDNNFPSDDSILNYLNQKYFNTKEINVYNKVVTLCDTNTILVLKDIDDFEINCNNLFNEILEVNNTVKINKELTLVDNRQLLYLKTRPLPYRLLTS